MTQMPLNCMREWFARLFMYLFRNSGNVRVFCNCHFDRNTKGNSLFWRRQHNKIQFSASLKIASIWWNWMCHQNWLLSTGLIGNEWTKEVLINWKSQNLCACGINFLRNALLSNEGWVIVQDQGNHFYCNPFGRPSISCARIFPCQRSIVTPITVV